MTYYDSNSSPRACFADGIAIATYASVGQLALTVAPEKALASMADVIMIRVIGGPGFKYMIPTSSLPKLGEMNKTLDPRGRYGAAMDGLFQVEATP